MTTSQPNRIEETPSRAQSQSNPAPAERERDEFLRRFLADTNEHGWAIVGRRRGGIWLGRCAVHCAGESASVELDGAWVLQREESRGDVLGFCHTHPAGPAGPSERDVRTMRAWCSAFGKPLLCVILSPAGLRAYRFDDDASAGEALAQVESFARRIIVAVEGTAS